MTISLFLGLPTARDNGRNWNVREKCILATLIFNIRRWLAGHRVASVRVVVGSALVARAGLILLSDPPPINVTIPAILLIGAGVLLIAGLWTPVAGAAVALTEIWKMFMLPGDKSVWLLLATVGAALAMLGPGLWSVDARLYSWKRLEPTPRQKSSHLPKNPPKD